MNVAITGGIGSGKSSVAKYLVKQTQAAHCDTDQYCKEMLMHGNVGWKGVVEKWGQRFLTSSGEIDRPLLRRTIFNHPEVKSEIEGILHPLVVKHVEELIVSCQKKDRLLVVEVPLLFEIGWQAKFDKVVTVFASNEECIKRVRSRDGVTGDEAEKVINTQIPLVEKVKLSDYVIDNSGSWGATRDSVDIFIGCLDKK